MKRFFAVLMILVVLVSICGCSQTSVNKNADVILTFVYGEDNISVTLEDLYNIAESAFFQSLNALLTEVFQSFLLGHIKKPADIVDAVLLPVIVDYH